MSCSTNASRSAGLSVLSTTCSAIPTAYASNASCWGSVPTAGSSMIGSGRKPSSGCSPRVLPGLQHAQSHPGDHGGQPPDQAVDLIDVGPRQPQPRLPQGVVGLIARAEDPVGDRRG
jgi:hypothetical protein